MAGPLQYPTVRPWAYYRPGVTFAASDTDDRRDRRAIAAVATQFFVNGAVVASFFPRLPEIRDRIDVSLDVLGALLTAAGLFGLVGSALSSGLIARLGTRRALIGGGIGLIACLPLVGFATAGWMFVVALGLLGAFDVIVDVAMNLQGSWLSARRHTPIMNRLHGLWSLGTVAGGLIAVQLSATGVSLQWHLTIMALVLLAALAFVATGLLTEDESGETESAAEDAAATGPDAPGTASSRSRTLLLGLAVAGGLAITMEIVSSDWAAFRLRDDFATSSGFAGLGFVAMTAGMTAGRFGGDALQLKLGSRRLGHVAVSVAAVGLAIAALVPDRWAVLAGYAIAGLGISTFFPRLYDQAAQLPGRSGAGLAALTAGSRIAVLIVPLSVGALAATSLSVGSATALVVLPSVVAFGALTLRT